MPVVITKPEDQQPVWHQALNDAGWDTHSLPLLGLESLPETPAQRAVWLDLDHFQGVVLISPRAAEQCAEAMDRYWPQPPMGVHWLSPGPGTAHVFSELYPQIEVSFPATGHTSEHLLAMTQTQSVQGEKWLLVAGQGGRDMLASTLTERGASVTRQEVYKRFAHTLSIEQLQVLSAPDTIVQISSQMALESLTSQVPLVTKQRATLLVSSHRLTQTARELGWQHFIQANGASLDATLESLAAYRTKNREQ